jgi:uncharacterized membrane protein YgcG
MASANWTLVEADPDLAGYTQQLLEKMEVQLRRVERNDPTTVIVLAASIFVLIFSLCFAGATCALRCCLRRWSRLLDEPPPSAQDGLRRVDDDGDGGEDGGDGGDGGGGGGDGGDGGEEQRDRARGLELE